jgi:ubiquinone/menaquinone biosynthesis C-methylase UbiE
MIHKTKKNNTKRTKNTTKKKQTQKLVNVNNLIIGDPTYKDKFTCFYNEYKNLLKDDFNYKKYYKDYESDQQIKAVVNISLKFNPHFFSRLIDLVLKRFNPIMLTRIINILLSKENDTKIYEKLKNLYRNKQNKFKYPSTLACNKNKILSQNLYQRAKPFFKIDITNYLDIGAGSGNFTIAMGNELKLNKDHIFGVDLDNFSEQGDWNRDKNKDKFTFKTIKPNEKYPFEDNMFEIITMKMVLHHIENIDFTFKEIKRILKKNGFLIIIDHDAFTYVDYMLADIEHGFYINVYEENSYTEDYKISKKITKEKEKESIGIAKYYDWIEISHLMNKYGFRYSRGDILSDHINTDVASTRASYYIFEQINK